MPEVDSGRNWPELYERISESAAAGIVPMDRFRLALLERARDNVTAERRPAAEAILSIHRALLPGRGRINTNDVIAKRMQVISVRGAAARTYWEGIPGRPSPADEIIYHIGDNNWLAAMFAAVTLTGARTVTALMVEQLLPVTDLQYREIVVDLYHGLDDWKFPQVDTLASLLARLRVRCPDWLLTRSVDLVRQGDGDLPRPGVFQTMAGLGDLPAAHSDIVWTLVVDDGLKPADAMIAAQRL